MGPSPNGVNPCNLALVSTNGDYFTLTYSGSCCLTNGMVLMNADPYAGYTRTVLSFTDYPASNTVVALTRPTLLAEALESGTLSSGSPLLLTNSAGGSVRPKDLSFSKDFPLQFNIPLVRVLYQDANGFLLETTAGSTLNLGATLELAGNFQGHRLSAFQAQVIGSAGLELDVHAKAGASKTFDGTIPLLEPAPTARYYLLAGGWWPVWVDVKFELNAVCSAMLAATAEATAGVNALKTITIGKKWSATGGWQDIFENPPLDFSFSTPTWQVQASADLVVTLQPKVTVLVYSAAGVEADLDPYLELSGSAQANPYQWNLGLYAGMDANIGLDLSVWDSSWGDLPSLPLTIIPKQTVWQASGPPSVQTPPQITTQPQSQPVSVGATVAFSVQAEGSAPLGYHWYRNGLPLTDDTRITGSANRALMIANAQTSDAGTYTARASNPAGAVTSAAATLTVWTGSGGSNPGGMALIPAGSFTMGDVAGHQRDFMGDGRCRSAFSPCVLPGLRRTGDVCCLWQQVYNWALAHGYSFDDAGAGKACDPSGADGGLV